MPDTTPNAAAWETTDGFIFDATITDAYFGFDPRKGDGEQLLITLEMEVDGGEERQQLYTLGSGWELADNGKRVNPINERRFKFSTRSNYGLFLATAVEVGAPMAERGLPNEAAVWKGLSFTFEQKQFDNNKQGQDRIEWSVLLPTDYLGDKSDKQSGSGAKAKDASDDARILGELKSIAATAGSYAEWAERAVVEVKGVEDSDEWSRKILDSEFYTEIKAG